MTIRIPFTAAAHSALRSRFANRARATAHPPRETPTSASVATTIILIAKETIPGKVKTRLTPALSFEQAATLAAASISDTLAELATLPAGRRILLFDGVNPPAGSEDYEVIQQVSGDLDERLAAIFDECTGPTILIGMDTPQVRAADLAPAFAPWPADVDAFFGPANDGGFWALGLANPRGDLIRGVPMSRDDTGIVQLLRLVDAGLGVFILPELTDVDTIDDALEVAALAPYTDFAATLTGFIGEAAMSDYVASARVAAARVGSAMVGAARVGSARVGSAPVGSALAVSA